MTLSSDERKTNAKEDENEPQGKEIFVGSTKKPSSELETKVLDDIQRDQSINIETIMEMTIRQLENDKTLRDKYPDDLKKLRHQWKEFSALFERLTKNIN